MTDKNPIIEAIGKDSFEWLLREFSRETTLKDVPDEVLDRIGSVDITVRDYASNRDAITSIAVITFAYKLANNTRVRVTLIIEYGMRLFSNLSPGRWASGSEACGP
jgi:hypothetical protein